MLCPPHHVSHVIVFFYHSLSANCVLTSAPTSSLPVRPPKATSLGQLENRPLHTDVLAWIQETSSNKMPLQITQITVNKYRLHSRHRTSTHKTKSIKCLCGHVFIPFIFKLRAQSNYSLIEDLLMIHVYQGWRIVVLKNIFGMTS